MSEDKHSRWYTTGVIAFALAWLIAAPAIVGHTSDDGIILNRYSTRWLAVLLVYFAVPVAALLTLRLLRPHHLTEPSVVARWLAKAILPVILLVYGAIELWFAVRLRLDESQFFRFEQRNLVLMALGFVSVIVVLFVVLGGQTAEKKKRITGNLVMATFSLSFTFVVVSYVAVLVFNVGNYRQVREEYIVTIVPDADLGSRMVMGDVIDADGFRNVDAGTRDNAPVVLVGDSFAYGQYVDYEQAWGYLIGQSLDVDVANYGQPGYSMWQYNVVLDKYVSAGDHEVVLYAIFANDLIDDRDAEERQPYHGYNPGLWYRSPVDFMLYSLFKESLTASLSRLVRKALRDKPNEATVEVDAQTELTLFPGQAPAANYAGSRAERVVLERARTAINLAAEQNVTLVIVLIPSKESAHIEDFEAAFSAGQTQDLLVEEAAYANICALAESENVRCLDLTPILRAEAASYPYMPFDGHWNPTGHEIAAAAVVDFLQAESVLAEE